MVRTQVILTAKQHELLKRASRAGGQSLSALVRQAVDAMLVTKQAPKKEALRLLGAFKADKRDVSARHDFYFSGGK